MKQSEITYESHPALFDAITEKMEAYKAYRRLLAGRGHYTPAGEQAIEDRYEAAKTKVRELTNLAKSIERFNNAR